MYKRIIDTKKLFKGVKKETLLKIIAAYELYHYETTTGGMIPVSLLDFFEKEYQVKWKEKYEKLIN